MMLKNPRLYCPENVEKARFMQIAVTVLAAVVSGYLAFSAFSGVRQVWNAQSLLTKERTESASLSREVSALKRRQEKMPPRTNGGVDAFALQLSRWAAEQNVRIEAVTPQGGPIANEITVGSASLGTWNAVKVRVEGQGDFQHVKDLLDRFRKPDLPVQLESFAFQSGSNGGDVVTFDLTLTVYERKIGAS